TGWIMGFVGPSGFFLFITSLCLCMAAYAGYRMTQRAAPSVEDTDSYSVVAPSASPAAVAIAQEIAIEAAQESEEA
ncbi:MAG: MFS transporter, partial [Pseudomonadota bacterium]